MNDTGQSKNRFRWISRIVIVALVLPLGLLVIGFIFESIASKSDWDRYPHLAN